MSMTLPLPTPEQIPAELPARAQWVAARYVVRDGKRTKVPINPDTGEYARPNHPATWATFDAAHAFARRHGLMVGYVFSADDPYTGVDIDHCRDPESGELTHDAFAPLAVLGTFTEASVSGTGAHAILRAKKSGPRCRKQGSPVEIYDERRVFVFTGRRLDGLPATIKDRQEELDAVYRELFGDEPRVAFPPVAPPECSLDDADVLSRARQARNGPKFAALFDAGDWRAAGYASHSEARQALCSLLAFWVGPDPARIERLFQRSALYRPDKWPRERADVLAIAANRREYWTPARWPTFQYAEVRYGN